MIYYYRKYFLGICRVNGGRPRDARRRVAPSACRTYAAIRPVRHGFIFDTHDTRQPSRRLALARRRDYCRYDAGALRCFFAPPQAAPRRLNF